MYVFFLSFSLYLLNGIRLRRSEDRRLKGLNGRLSLNSLSTRCKKIACGVIIEPQERVIRLQR